MTVIPTPLDPGTTRDIRARPSLRKARVTRLALGLACATVACHSPRTAPRSRELVVNLTADADVLLPPFTSTTQGAIVADQIFERLADPDSTVNTIGDKDYQPRLADHWTWAQDSMSIAFHVDPRARWQDGVRVTARDVQFSFRVFKDSADGSITAPLLSNVDSASVRDSATAVVWFHSRTPDQFYTATYSPRVLPAHLLDTIPPARLRTSVYGRAPVGSGPYRFVRWAPGSFIQLGADSAYRGGRPAFNELLFTITRDPSVAVTRLLAHEVDFLDRVGASDIPRVRSQPELALVRWPSEENVALLFNLGDGAARHARSPLEDRRVREAMTLAIDRGALVRGLLGETARVAQGPFPAILLDSVFLPDVSADSTAAARLLDAAGWARDPATGLRRKDGRPLSVRLLVPTSSTERMGVAVVLQAQLRRIGVDLAIDQTELNASLQDLESGQFEATLLDLTWDPSPASARQIWASASAPPGGSNFGRYANPEFDAILDSALAARRVDRARVLYRRAWSALVRDAPAVWLYDLVNVGAVRRPIDPRGLSADGWWSELAWWGNDSTTVVGANRP